jgi:hypothetical protein
MVNHIKRKCNNRPFSFLSHVTQKVFDLESWNLTGMLISMCSCAPGYFRVNLFSIFIVIALDLVKICNFQLSSHVKQKVFDLESWNFTGMLISMCSSAPGYFRLDTYTLSVFPSVRPPLFMKQQEVSTWNFVGR